MKIKPDDYNLRYCLQFLRNGGERLRAVALAKKVLNLSVVEAFKYVDGLKEKVALPTNRKRNKYCAACGVTWRAETPECPTCGAKELLWMA